MINSFLKNRAIRYSSGKKMNLSLYIVPYPKINFRYNIDLNLRGKNNNTSRKHCTRIFHGSRVCKDRQNRTLEVLNMEEK